MSDHLLIYLIVALNIVCQLMLIWRQKTTSAERGKFCCLAVAIPLVLMVAMRLLIAGGMMHGRIIEQPLVEQYVTRSASMLLIAGPWLVTLLAVVSCRRQRAAASR